MLRVAPDPAGNDSYPAGVVQVGHTWAVEASALAGNFGGWLAEPEGALDAKFVRVETVGGEECAVVETAGTATGRSKAFATVQGDGAGAQTGEAEFEVRSTVYRSLKTGLDVKSSYSGKVKITVKVAAGESDIEIVIAGPVSGEETRTAK